MQNASLQKHIIQARQLLRRAMHAAIATVNVDSSPHNTPLFFSYNKDLTRLYWSSHPASLHSQNVRRTGQVFVVLYEAAIGGGLYIAADQAKELDGDELQEALRVHNMFRKKHNKSGGLLPLSHYENDGPQRMYSAVPTHFYVNANSRDEAGRIVQDARIEINSKVLAS